ncbi:MAG: sulfotransferase [Magnetococcales bacterium]|nr:sulfotransferase [Magnetococcales bacterium]
MERECFKLLAKTQSGVEKSSVQALLAIVILQQGNSEASRKYLEESRQYSTNMDPSALADLGGGYLLLEEPDTALQYLELAIAKDPKLALAHGRAGMALMKLGRLCEAQDSLILARDLEPGLAAYCVNLARIQLLLGEPQSALDELDHPSLNNKPATPLAKKSRVEALLALNRLDEAEKLAHEILQGSGVDEPDGLTIYTLVLAACNRHNEAELYLRKALGKFPDNIEILGQLAELSLLQGRFGQAVEYLGRCIKKEPENSSLWARLSRACAPNYSQEAAIQAALKAVELTKGKTGLLPAEAITALAFAHSHGDEHIEAQKYFLQALKEVEDFPQARLGYGYLLLHLGKINEAIGHFETVNEKNPVIGFSALTTARRFPDDPTILEKIEKAARMPSLQGPVRSNLMFDLAVAWEKAKSYAKAFELATEANRVSQLFLPYNPEVHRGYVEEIMGAFSKEFFAQRKDFGDPSKLPIFVLGMPRSGTTLVEQILASHPDIFGAGELGQIPSLIATLSAWEQHIGSTHEYPQCISELTNSESQTLAQPLLADLQQFEPSALRVVDKLPHNFENIGLIHLFFPNATIIHIQRDARDCAISNYFTDYQAKFGGMGFAYDLKNIGEQLVDHQRLMDHWHRVLPGRILEIPYEGLVEKPEYYSRKMLEKIGIDWNPQVLNFNKLDRTVKTASFWQVRQPIYKTSRQRWRNYSEFLEPLQKALSVELANVVSVTDGKKSALPPGYFIKGVTMINNHNNREAETIFRKILDCHPKHAGATHYLGIARFRLGNQLKGVALVEVSVKLNPHRHQWFENLAKMYKQLNLPAQEAAALKSAKDLLEQPTEPWHFLFEYECKNIDIP